MSKDNIDVAFFIAKTEDEFVFYKKGNSDLSECTVGGNRAMFSCSSTPKIVVVCAYDAIKFFENNDERGNKFWKHVKIIIKNTIGIEEAKKILVLAHWGNLNIGTNDWEVCNSFINSIKPDDFDFMLISSSGGCGTTLGLGGNGPIHIPRGTDFYNWLKNTDTNK